MQLSQFWFDWKTVKILILCLYINYYTTLDLIITVAFLNVSLFPLYKQLELKEPISEGQIFCLRLTSRNMCKVITKKILFVFCFQVYVWFETRFNGFLLPHAVKFQEVVMSSELLI